MYGYNLRLNVGKHVWLNSKELYNPKRQIIIDKFRDGCTRNPCCRDIINKKNKFENDQGMWPLPIFLIWSNGIYVNHVLCFLTEDEARRWLIQWINEEHKKFMCGKWSFPDIHVKNVFGNDVSSFVHPIYDDGQFVEKITNGQINNNNFWNNLTMETYKNHDFFNTDSVNSVDDMSHWNKQLSDWANNFVENFYNESFPIYWNIKLTMSNEYL